MKTVTHTTSASMMLGALISVLLAMSALTAGCGPSADTLYTRAMAFLEKPETVQEGIDTLTTLIDRHPDDRRVPDALLALAAARQTVGGIDASIQTYDRVVRDFPDTPQAYKARFLLGYIYYDALNDTDQATRILNAFIHDYPDSSLASSARVILDNIDVPFDDWGVVKAIGADSPGEEAPQAANTSR